MSFALAFQPPMPDPRAMNDIADVARPAETVGAAPVADGARQKSVDVLRGVALLGILVMNIPVFALPDYYSEPFRSDPRNINFWFRLVINTLFEGKARALFGMLFGVGVLLFIANKEKAGKSVHWLFYRRTFLLVLFGLFQAHVMLWVGEILYCYGVCGMIVYLFRRVNPRILVLAVPLVGLIDFGLGVRQYQVFREQRIAYVAASEAKSHGDILSDVQTKALADWRVVETTLIPNREDVQENTRQIKSGYAGAASYVRPRAWLFETKYLPLWLPDSVALMLLGMGLFKMGFFSGTWSVRAYRRVMLVGYGLGLPLVGYAFYDSLVRFPNHEAFLKVLETVPILWADLIYPFQRMLLVMAHAAALILVYRAGALAWLTRRLAAVGQMALTNYLMHTVFCTLIFFGYGLNLYGELQFYQLYFVVAAIWAFQLVTSPWWLARFRFGPFEWLWRALTYSVRPPMRRAG